jgi:endogenous inhibitor of DNA gyrase (YacG/DUF329 family)
MKAKKTPVAWNLDCPHCGAEMECLDGLMWTEVDFDKEKKVKCPVCGKVSET